jgi:hypothetical protein
MLALGSRNRIFNVFSLNEYTRIEMSLGTVERLLAEGIAFSSAPCMESALAAPGFDKQLPQPSAHPGTGIGVAVRYQYTPGELAALVRDAGFAPLAVYPVHYHALPPTAAKRLLKTHVGFSNSIFEDAAEDHRLVPFSSSFVLAAQKQ